MRHRERPRPIETSFCAGRVAQLTSRRRTAGPVGWPKPRFSRKRVFLGGGYFGHFGGFLGQQKIRGERVTLWTTFGHKILLSQTVMSLQSLS